MSVSKCMFNGRYKIALLQRRVLTQKCTHISFPVLLLQPANRIRITISSKSWTLVEQITASN